MVSCSRWLNMAEHDLVHGRTHKELSLRPHVSAYIVMSWQPQNQSFATYTKPLLTVFGNRQLISMGKIGLELSVDGFFATSVAAQNFLNFFRCKSMQMATMSKNLWHTYGCYMDAHWMPPLMSVIVTVWLGKSLRLLLGFGWRSTTGSSSHILRLCSVWTKAIWILRDIVCCSKLIEFLQVQTYANGHDVKELVAHTWLLHGRPLNSTAYECDCDRAAREKFEIVIGVRMEINDRIGQPNIAPLQCLDNGNLDWYVLCKKHLVFPKTCRGLSYMCMCLFVVSDDVSALVRRGRGDCRTGGQRTFLCGVLLEPAFRAAFAIWWHTPPDWQDFPWIL